MRRQFFRVYAVLASVAVLLAALSLFAARRTIEREVDRRVETALTPGIRMMRDRLARGPRGLRGPDDRPGRLRAPEPRFDEAWRSNAEERILVGLREAYGVDVALRTASALDVEGHEAARIRSGDVVLLRHPEHGRLVYALLPHDRLLVLGPFPQADARAWALRRTLSVAGLLAVLGLTLGVMLVPLERRLAHLGASARRLGEGELTTRVRDTHDDAIGEVGRSFDEMAARLHALVDGQKELFHAVSHELRTPLARLLFLLEEIDEEAASERVRRRVARAERSVDEIDRLVDELLRFARLDEVSPELSDVDLASLVAGVVERLPPHEVEVSCDIAPGVSLRADPTLLQRALDNVTRNAVRYATSAVHVHVARGADAWEIIVDDDGPGIPAAERERIFEPFAQLDRARGERGAAGLGLAIVARVCARHGASVRADASPSGGARLLLRWPL